MAEIAPKPFPGEVQEARRFPNGWVYRIAGRFAEDEHVPPEAIIGAWRVDETGTIVGEFTPNPNYDEERWPSSGRPSSELGD